MATLTGNAINTSYSGLLKTTDNGALTATAKVMTDGLGNNSTLQMGTAGAIFTGTLDLTGATVTGLPVDPNTTYDLAAVASGSNINLNLTGSDATTDTVSIVAGTNITLSEASGIVTIDAAGGGGGSFESPLSPARKFKTTANNYWNFAMPQDGNNYDGGGLQSLTDVSNSRRFFTQIYTDTVTDFAILVGDGYTGSFRVELFDAWDTTGMPKSVIATTTSFTAGSSGAGLTWYTGGFSSTQTLNYEQYYIAITGINSDADIYSAIGCRWLY